MPDWIDYSTFDAEVTWNLRENLHKKLQEMPWAKGKSMYEFYMTYWRPFGELLTGNFYFFKKNQQKNELSKYIWALISAFSFSSSFFV